MNRYDIQYNRDKLRRINFIRSLGVQNEERNKGHACYGGTHVGDLYRIA